MNSKNAPTKIQVRVLVLCSAKYSGLIMLKYSVKRLKAMQKAVMYVFVLVIGVAIGIPVGVFVLSQQTPSMEEQVKVTILGIEYETSDSVLKIELLNDVPEKNLEGNVVVFQDEKQWTSEVTWYYTGYGEAEIICDSIDETQNFRITYIENNPKSTYLDRIIEWNEVSQTFFAFMETEEMKITSVVFPSIDNTTITVNVQNTGTTDVSIITTVTVSGLGVTGGSTTAATVGKGGTGIFSVELGTEEWSEGSTYTVELLSTKGNKFVYTATA